jgi:hypothetical protein
MLAGIRHALACLRTDVTKRVSVRTTCWPPWAAACRQTGYSITGANLPGWTGCWALRDFCAVHRFYDGRHCCTINIVDGWQPAAGTVIIILTAFGVMMTALGDPDLAQVCLILAGAVAGFC